MSKCTDCGSTLEFLCKCCVMKVTQRKYRKKYLAKHPEMNGKSQRDWEKRNREKYLARRKVAYALAKGKIVRELCEVCGKVKTDAHHPDYRYPLKVRWLCRLHHKEEHSRLRE